MKKILLVLMSVAIALFAFVSCENTSPQVLDIQELIDIKNSQKAQLARLAQTRALDLPSDSLVTVDVDPAPEQQLSHGVLTYIDKYVEDFRHIDEDQFLAAINSDPNLEAIDKIDLAEILGNGEYLKETMATVSPSATKGECLDTWKAETKAAMEKFLVDGAACLLSGDLIGLALATATAWRETDRALDNYNNCMATAN